jgi:peptide/nickel transport system substrate-binding protein
MMTPLRNRFSYTFLRSALAFLGFSALALAGPLGEGRATDEVDTQKAAPVDQFHPDAKSAATPAYGGQVVVHLSSMPEGLCRAVENSAVSRWMLYEVNDTLVLQDWETWEFKPSLCEGWVEEDQIILKPEAASKYPQAREIGSGDKLRQVLYGKVELVDGTYSVSSASRGNPVEGTLEVPAADVESVQEGTVFTFYLPTNVKWHDGHPFDAEDVMFSWDLFNNSEVDCDEIRFQYQQILDGELIDKQAVRFFFEKQYFLALQVPGEMGIVPRRLYDLTDPDNKRYDPETHAEFARLKGADHVFTEAELGQYINENPHNTDWVGVGPYKIVSWDSKRVTAERFEDYHDPEKAGYVDKIIWRHISDDDTAFNGLINGELDYFARVKSEDYFGEGTEQEAFKDAFYKGYFYTGTYGYTGLNTLRPTLSDVNVRKALTIAFDWEDFKKTKYNDLAIRVNGPQNYFGPGYNREVEFLPYDPDLAEEMLAEAGWYDRDGNGIIDKDGIEMELEFLFPSGNAASESFGLRMQESYEPLGIKINMRNFEWSTFLERMLERKFDMVNLAWVPPVESDPEQLWHSKWGPAELKSSNMCGVMDEEVDRLIEAGQIELDKDKRAELWKALHKRLYEEIQPYMFGLNSPRKFAMNKNIRGFQAFKIAPGYSIRRWYYPAGTEGTRAELAK